MHGYRYAELFYTVNGDVLNLIDGFMHMIQDASDILHILSLFLTVNTLLVWRGTVYALCPCMQRVCI